MISLLSLSGYITVIPLLSPSGYITVIPLLSPSGYITVIPFLLWSGGYITLITLTPDPSFPRTERKQETAFGASYSNGLEYTSVPWCIPQWTVTNLRCCISILHFRQCSFSWVNGFESPQSHILTKLCMLGHPSPLEQRTDRLARPVPQRTEKLERLERSARNIDLHENISQRWCNKNNLISIINLLHVQTSRQFITELIKLFPAILDESKIRSNAGN